MCGDGYSNSWLEFQGIPEEVVSFRELTRVRLVSGSTKGSPGRSLHVGSVVSEIAAQILDFKAFVPGLDVC